MRRKDRVGGFVTIYQSLPIVQIILSIALIAVILLQSKQAGLGGLTGGDSGGIFRARRGVEKVLFYLAIVISFLFFALSLASVFILKTGS
jgi:preprotein translocase subunit SecG